MTRRWVPAAAVVAAVLLQLSWAPRWAIFGVRPDLVTLVVVCLGFLGGPQTGAVAGFLGGLALDVLSLGVVGAGALSRAVAGFVAGLFEQNLFGTSVVLPMLAVATATMLAESLELATLLLIGTDLPILASVIRIVIPTALYNGLLAALAYPLLAWLVRRPKGKASIEQLG